MWGGGEGFQVLAGEFGIGYGEELLIQIGLTGEVAVAERWVGMFAGAEGRGADVCAWVGGVWRDRSASAAIAARREDEKRKGIKLLGPCWMAG